MLEESHHSNPYKVENLTHDEIIDTLHKKTNKTLVGFVPPVAAISLLDYFVAFDTLVNLE